MIVGPSVRQADIRRHYDLATLFYRLLWGPHIHHGLWEGRESATQAQQQLTDRLAREAGIRGGERVLDVGCGMGGSSIHLASTFDCQVTGITLSPIQRFWASTAAWARGASPKCRFLRADAERVCFDPRSFDVIWSIECTEHLFDKPAFFRRTAGWLDDGGRVAICAWLAGDGTSDDHTHQVRAVCEAFLCPSLGREADYVKWMQEADLKVDRVFDWTDRVVETWEICMRRVRRTGVRWLARWIDQNQVQFLDHFATILKAYRTGAMRYGCFIARG